MKQSGRRDFLRAGMAGVAALGAVGSASAKPDAKPNILFITTDQQFADVMSCAGSKWVKCPEQKQRRTDASICRYRGGGPDCQEGWN